MARLTLELPDEYVFSIDLTVRASEINYGGHVGNDKMLGLMQEARIQYYYSLGVKSELHLDENVGQIISDALVIYKSESFMGDTLTIKIAVRDVNKYGFDLVYRVSNKESGKEVARGKTGVVCFDYTKRRVAPLPASLLHRMMNG